jgi:hypothetical protein
MSGRENASQKEEKNASFLFIEKIIFQDHLSGPRCPDTSPE